MLQALLSSHRPLGAYEVIDELAKSMPRPAPITVYREALASNLYDELPTVKTLGVLRRKAT